MNIAVFFGSRSPEHDISIITGQLIISELKKLGHEVTPVYITKEGLWLIGENMGKLKTFTHNGPPKTHKKGSYYLDINASREKMVFKQKGFRGKTITIDLAFPALHGSYGEDGTMQGLFEMFNIPYVGCDVQSSAVAMDKVTTKLVLQALGYPTPKFAYYSLTEWNLHKQTVVESIPKKVPFPLFIKPAHMGSSIGIAKVKNEKELEYALEVAFHYDDKVLAEEAITNMRDETCCVIGNENPIPSLLQESLYEKDFFSYEDKYLKDGGAQLGHAKQLMNIPAKLDQKTTEKIQTMACDVYRALGCSGIARVDFLYEDKTKKYYVNEINPLPGTLYHHLWKASGVEINELLTKLINYAQERHEAKKKLTFTFESDLLKMADSAKLRLQES